ncbi:MAG: hypothetical protein J7M01_05230 [Candidatus Marinimicrobia bacterium]|nr:hypothetical protein [Candidatus Neomarinimicrobiota bacterium]
MQNTWKAIPGKGIGSIFFGISKKHLVKLLDEPDALDTTNEEGGVCEHYYYDDLDVTFTFSSAENDRLLVITIGNPKCLIADVLQTGMEMEDALAKIEKLQWGAPEIEEIEKGDMIFSYGDTGVDVWFEDGILTGFQLSPQWEDDDTIAWPT